MNKEIDKEGILNTQSNDILYSLYTHGNKNGVRSLYDILKSEELYPALKDTLILPSVRIIGDDVFIKTYEYQSDGITRSKRFFIVLNKMGNILPSYHNQFVQVKPSFILVAGSYKNQIIDKSALELFYCTSFDKIELEKYVGSEQKYALKINTQIDGIDIQPILDNIHEYAKEFPWWLNEISHP